MCLYLSALYKNSLDMKKKRPLQNVDKLLNPTFDTIANKNKQHQYFPHYWYLKGNLAKWKYLDLLN